MAVASGSALAVIAAASGSTASAAALWTAAAVLTGQVQRTAPLPLAQAALPVMPSSVWVCCLVS